MDYSEKGSKMTSITHKEYRKKGVELSPSKRAETILMNKYNVELDGNNDKTSRISKGFENKDSDSDDYNVNDPNALKNAVSGILSALGTIKLL
jgi:hypothetical protein